MAYDETLAARVRDAVGGRDGVSEKKMFGGVAWMVRGNMACGVHGDDLIVRLPPDEADRALTEPGTRVFDLTGRPMRGWVLVAGDAVAEDAALGSWVDAGANHAASLPPK